MNLNLNINYQRFTMDINFIKGKMMGNKNYKKKYFMYIDIYIYTLVEIYTYLNMVIFKL